MSRKVRTQNTSPTQLEDNARLFVDDKRVGRWAHDLPTDEHSIKVSPSVDLTIGRVGPFQTSYFPDLFSTPKSNPTLLLLTFVLPTIASLD